MKKNLLWQMIVTVVTLATLVVNGLANALPLNGLETGEISDRFAIYFVPAGYVFSIWGLIYLGLLAFTVYQALPAQRENPRLQRIRGWYTLSGLANIVWIFLWHYEVFPLTIVAMLIILGSLIVTFLRLGIGVSAAATGETWAVRVPFSIYLGWISVATVANATQLLYYLNWNGFGIAPEAWAVIMLVVAAGIALAMSLTRGNIAYVLVFVWAYAGIAVKHAPTPVVAIPAGVLAVLLGLSLFLTVPRVQRRLG